MYANLFKEIIDINKKIFQDFNKSFNNNESIREIHFLDYMKELYMFVLEHNDDLNGWYEIFHMKFTELEKSDFRKSKNNMRLFNTFKMLNSSLSNELGIENFALKKITLLSYIENRSFDLNIDNNSSRIFTYKNINKEFF